MEWTVTYTKLDGRKGLVIVFARNEEEAIEEAMCKVLGSNFREPRKCFTISI